MVSVSKFDATLKFDTADDILFYNPPSSYAPQIFADILQRFTRREVPVHFIPHGSIVVPGLSGMTRLLITFVSVINLFVQTHMRIFSNMVR